MRIRSNGKTLVYKEKAKTWLNSTTIDVYLMSWHKFCQILCERVPCPRAEESMELCQLFKQTSSVDHYVAQFGD
jgi:hypothetical protein